MDVNLLIKGVRIYPKNFYEAKKITNFFKNPDIPTLILDPNFLQDIVRKGCLKIPSP